VQSYRPYGPGVIELETSDSDFTIRRSRYIDIKKKGAWGLRLDRMEDIDNVIAQEILRCFPSF